MPTDPQPAAPRTRAWRAGRIVARDFPLTELGPHLAPPDTLFWADLADPDAEALGALGRRFELDAHAIEDALGYDERPKATWYGPHLFLTTTAIARRPGAAAHGPLLDRVRVSAFVLPRGMITVRLGAGFDIDAVVRRWDANGALLAHGPAALVHGLLDVIVDGYFAAIESLDDDLEAIEDVLFDENAMTAKHVQRRTFALRKSLVQTRRAVLPMREVVGTLMRAGSDSEQTGALASYYADLHDHTLRAAEWTESLRDMITSIFETNMSLADTRMNLIMKKLTGWAAIIAVPTAITGYYGQNVPYPGSDRLWGYFLSLGLIFGIAAALYLVFRRKDWL